MMKWPFWDRYVPQRPSNDHWFETYASNGMISRCRVEHRNVWNHHLDELDILFVFNNKNIQKTFQFSGHSTTVTWVFFSPRRLHPRPNGCFTHHQGTSLTERLSQGLLCCENPQQCLPEALLFCLQLLKSLRFLRVFQGNPVVTHQLRLVV